MAGRVMLTIHTVDKYGLSAGIQTHLVKVGEELKVAHPLESNISTIVIDRIEED